MKQYKITIYKHDRVVCESDAPIITNMAEYCEVTRAFFGRDCVIEFEIEDKS